MAEPVNKVFQVLPAYRGCLEIEPASKNRDPESLWYILSAGNPADLEECTDCVGFSALLKLSATIHTKRANR
jgi:hypothetical protein